MQGGVRLVVETHMQEFSGKRQRFPENGVQDSKICWRSDSLPSWFQLVLSQFFFFSSHNFLCVQTLQLKDIG